MLRFVTITVVLVPGCIEVSQSTSIPDDANDAMGTSDTDEADADATPACNGANPCAPSSDPCQPVECVGGRCVAAPASGVPCALDDLCRIGVCQEGRCISVPLACPSDDPCRTPVCDPRFGCDTVPVTDGFCESTPAFPWGECIGPLMTPPDSCDSEARCVDVPVGGPRAPAFPNILSTWLALTFEAHSAARTTRVGPLELNLAGDIATAAWQPQLDTALTGPALPVDALTGGWCMDAENGFNINLPGVGSWVGQVARSGDVFAAMRLNANELMVAVRPGSPARPPDGPYRLALSHADAYGAMDLWVGTVRFSEGCLVGEPMLRHGVEVRDFTLERIACFAVEDTSRAGPMQSARFLWRDDDTHSRPIELVGGLTDTADLGIFALRDGEGRPQPGFAMLVRESPFFPNENNTLYAAAIERRPTGVDRFVHGGLRFVATVREARLVNGHVERAVEATTPGEWQ